MAFSDYVKEGIEIIKLNSKAITKAAKDEDAFKYGLLILIIAGVAHAFGQRNIFAVVLNPIWFVIAAFIGVAIVHFFAILLGGKAQYMELFRSWSIANVLQWVGILGLIPFLGGLVVGLAGLWMIVVGVVIVQHVHSLSLGRAVLAVLMPIIIIGAIILLLSLIFAATMFSFMGGSMMGRMWG